MPCRDQFPDQRGESRVAVEPTGQKERAGDLLPLQHGEDVLAAIGILVTGEDQADVFSGGITPDDGTAEYLALRTHPRFTSGTSRHRRSARRLAAQDHKGEREQAFQQDMAHVCNASMRRSGGEIGLQAVGQVEHHVPSRTDLRLR
jgi:hypothetical protein